MLSKLGTICNGAVCYSFRMRKCAHKSPESRNRKAPRIRFWCIFHWKILTFTEKCRHFTEKHYASLSAQSKNFIHWKQNALLQNTEIQWEKLKLNFFTEKFWLSVKCSANHIPFCTPFSLCIWLLFTAVSLHISKKYSFFQWNRWQKLVQISVTNTLRRVFFTETMRIYYWLNQLYFSCFHWNCSIFH